MSGGIPPVALIVAALFPRAVLSTLPYPMKYISIVPLAARASRSRTLFHKFERRSGAPRLARARAKHPRRAPAPSTGATSPRRQPESGAARHGRHDDQGAAPLQVHHHRRYGGRQVEPHAHVYRKTFWGGPRHDDRSRAGAVSRRPVVWRCLHAIDARRLLENKWLLSAQASSSTAAPSN